MSLPLNIDVQQILLHLLNFLILAAGLYLLLYKPVHQFMKKRISYYEEQEKESNRQKEEVQEKKNEYEELLSSAEEEIRQLKIAEMNKITEETEDILARAKLHAGKILSDAEKEAVLQKKKIMKSAQKDISELVVTATQKLMYQNESDDNDSAIFDEFLKTVKEGDSINEQGKK